MSETETDYELLVTVRVYGPGSAVAAAQALTGCTFDLPGGAEAEILTVRPARKDAARGEA